MNSPYWLLRVLRVFPHTGQLPFTSGGFTAALAFSTEPVQGGEAGDCGSTEFAVEVVRPSGAVPASEGSCVGAFFSGKRLRTSFLLATPSFFAKMPAATMARPQAEVSAFMSSLSFVYGVVPGTGSA